MSQVLEELPGDVTATLLKAEALAGLKRVPEALALLDRVRLTRGGSGDPVIREGIGRVGAILTALTQPRPKRMQRVRAVTPNLAATAAPEAKLPPLSIPLRAEPAALALPRPEAGDPAPLLEDYRIRRLAQAVQSCRDFESLLALGIARGVDHYDFQLRTVRRVLRDFHGRVLLADEVGLGKTVEAILCLAEYTLRGLVRRTLILVPPGLREQWHDELSNKFGIEARIIDGAVARNDALAWSDGSVLIASLGLARLPVHAEAIARASFDLVIVDEAHRLKNRRSRSWQLVDSLRSRFLILISATPVENDLLEIYNLLSLLKPGLFSTEAAFKRAFLDGGGGRIPKDAARLRTLLREVMIRNTRALVDVKLPPRVAATLRARPGEAESTFYAAVSQGVKAALREGRLRAHVATEMLRAAGSSPRAAWSRVHDLLPADILARSHELRAPAKDALLVDLLERRREEKVLLFSGHRETLDHVFEVTRNAGRRPVLLHGAMTAAEKESAVAAFAGDADVLVASDSGGEGFNLQFARTVVNYDLPWNPMRIEQRIGRVHRIGQDQQVFVFNLVTAGTLEEEILRVLDEKINMFELVVGEVDAILGRLGDDEREFQELVLEIYANAVDGVDLRRRFDELGQRMAQAHGEYAAVKAFESKVFGRELEA